MSGLFFDVEIDEIGIAKKAENLIDDKTMLTIHQAFAKIIYPFVPLKEGFLRDHTEITKDWVRYAAIYAHYMYIGEIYGPNIPEFQNGEIVGWWSQSGVQKKPTGRPITYNKELNSLATKEWDKVAMQTKLREFEEQVKKILMWRAKELYG